MGLVKAYRKAAGVLGLSVFALLAAMALWPDAGSAGDEDVLVSSVVSVPAAENSHGHYLRLKESLRLTEAEKVRIRQCVEDPACRAQPLWALILRQGEALRHFESLRDRHLQLPEWSDPSQVTEQTPLPEAWPALLAADLAGLKARALREQGRPAEAFEAALRLAETGQSYQSSAGALPLYLTGSAMKLRGLRSLRLEYTWQANMLSRLKNEGLPPDAGRTWAHRLVGALYFKPNRTRRLMAEDFRRTLSGVDELCPPAAPAPRRARAWWKNPAWLTGNLVGVIMHGVGQADYGRLLRRRCEEDFWLGATELALAAKGFTLRNGRPPAGADELAPRFLAEPPLDPFTGQPLAYSPETGEVSAAGVDAKGQPLRVRIAPARHPSRGG